MTQPLLLERCDPDAVLRSALNRVSAAEVHTIFMAWLLRLPVDVDAAAAASLVLHSVERSKSSTPLGRLLEETARFPRERLARLGRSDSVA
ncbi:MAG: hypothetical protein AAFY56_06490 [Pseudomonadota bacterium]